MYREGSTKRLNATARWSDKSASRVPATDDMYLLYYTVWSQLTKTVHKIMYNIRMAIDFSRFTQKNPSIRPNKVAIG